MRFRSEVLEVRSSKVAERFFRSKVVERFPSEVPERFRSKVVERFPEAMFRRFGRVSGARFGTGSRVVPEQAGSEVPETTRTERVLERGSGEVPEQVPERGGANFRTGSGAFRSKVPERFRTTFWRGS